MDYSFKTDPSKTPISRPLPGREKEMKKNLAGGYAFKADDFVALRRWLLTGSLNDAYYQGRRELTDLNLELLDKLVEVDPEKVAEEILYATDHGINNHTPILALVYLSKGEFKAKKAFRDIFSNVIRTASHLYEFMNYTKHLRGMGKTIHKAVKSWIYNKNARDLEYQFLKYQNRYGWTGRDVLRTIKPKPLGPGQDNIFRWVVGKMDSPDDFTVRHLKRINAYEFLKSESVEDKDVIRMIRDYSLTHEMIPANVKRTRAVWETLFEKMPIGATLRNLGNLTNKDVFGRVENVDILESRFTKEGIKVGRIHPLNLVSASLIYSAGGEAGRSKLDWVPVSRVQDILEVAIKHAFESLEPTGKFFFHAVDISPSMLGADNEQLWMTAADIAGVLALATAKAEKNYFIGGFAKTFVPLPFTKDMRYRDALGQNYMRGLGINWGGTNAGSAYQYAIDNNVFVDTFCFWTDGENWVGHHPAVKLKEYRNKINPDAKAIYMTLVPHGDQISLVDPKDPDSYDVAGFSSETVKLIQMIAGGIL